MTRTNKLRGLILLLTLSFIGFLLIFFTSGCITAQKCAERYPPVRDTSEVKTTTIREVVHDTMLVTKVDSARVEVYINCDSTGRAQVVSRNTTNGQTARARVTEQRSAGVLHAIFDCVCDSQAIYMTWKTKDTSDFHQREIKVIQPYPVPAKLTWWESTKIAFGGWAMGILSTLIIGTIAWWALKTYAKVQFPPLNFFK